MIDFDAASTAEHYGSSKSWAHTVGSGTNRLLLVGITIYQTTRRVSSVTWGAQSLTYITSMTRGANVRISWWQLKNPDSGTKNITVTLDGTSRCTFGAASYENVHQTTTFGTYAKTSSYGSTMSINVSSAADELVVDAAAWQGNSTASVGALQTSRYNRLGNPGSIKMGTAGSSEPGAGTVTMSWSLSSPRNWAIIGIPLKPAPTPPTPSVRKQAKFESVIAA